MAWHARLDLDYRRDAAADAGRDTPAPTVLHHRHVGPLRILKSLYPEGPAICHNVVVHPPGGLVGGDRLEVDAQLAPGAHALISTPGATRFYRSGGHPATQQVQMRVATGARLEWLPLETLVHSGAEAASRLQFDLAPGAEMIGWDVVALGLPASADPFVRGHYRHELSLPGRWLDRGHTEATDLALLDGPAGWAGRRVMATAWFATGDMLAPARAEALLDGARAVIGAAEGDGVPGTGPHRMIAGASAVQPGLIVLRVLADRVEPAFGLLTRVWQAWRPLAWGLAGEVPRVWRT